LGTGEREFFFCPKNFVAPGKRKGRTGTAPREGSCNQNVRTKEGGTERNFSSPREAISFQGGKGGVIAEKTTKERRGGRLPKRKRGVFCVGRKGGRHRKVIVF